MLKETSKLEVKAKHEKEKKKEKREQGQRTFMTEALKEKLQSSGPMHQQRAEHMKGTEEEIEQRYTEEI